MKALILLIVLFSFAVAQKAEWFTYVDDSSGIVVSYRKAKKVYKDTVVKIEFNDLKGFKLYKLNGSTEIVCEKCILWTTWVKSKEGSNGK